MRLIARYNRRFLLTGTSARKLKRGAANLLAGRWLLNEAKGLDASISLVAVGCEPDLAVVYERVTQPA